MGEIRFVGTGETRGYPYLVCKKIGYSLAYDIKPIIVHVACFHNLYLSEPTFLQFFYHYILENNRIPYICQYPSVAILH